MIGIILLLMLLLGLGILQNSLNILVVSGIVLAITFKNKNFFKRSYLFYIIGVILGTLTLIFNESQYFELIYKGIIGYGFMLVVMMVGILPNKLELSRSVKKNRGVFSILSFIFITPHAMLHVFGVFPEVNIFGIAAYVIMVPLTLISFKFIKKEIDIKDWITIQKAAYIIYIALFAHLIMVSAWQDKIIYAIIMTIYINNKLIKEVRKWNYLKILYTH